MNRVRDMLERSRRSLLDGSAKQRLEGSTRQLLERSRTTIAQLVGTPPAPGETGAREVLAGVCSSVALRELNLVDNLLEHLERMEANEDDPDALAQLYKLDHLATRLRRNGENLRVLAGRDAGGDRDQETSLVDVIRAGMSSIEHYTRVELGKIVALGVVGHAAGDVGRILTELLDNATMHSPPSKAVTVSAHLTEQGSVLVRIEDSGIGLPAARVSALNERLASAPVLDRNATRHMGIAVVRRLASRHSIRVWLSRRAPHGTVASVLLPTSLLNEAPGPTSPRQHHDPSAKRPSAERAGSVAESSRGVVVPEGSHQKNTLFADAAQPQSPSEEGAATTANGLPRRVPRSLKESAGGFPSQDSAATGRSWQDQHESHKQLLADLGAFVEGEQAAHEGAARPDAQQPLEGHDQ
jgi:signal transduction histidine kinase